MVMFTRPLTVDPAATVTVRTVVPTVPKVMLAFGMIAVFEDVPVSVSEVTGVSASLSGMMTAPVFEPASRLPAFIVAKYGKPGGAVKLMFCLLGPTATGLVKKATSGRIVSPVLVAVSV